jgi:sugar/nucleoside kinase (ribokinase family)
MNALVIGGSSWDTLIHVHELNEIRDDMMLWADHVIETVGGTGAGKALCLDALDNNVTLITTVGDDSYSSKIMEYFKNTKIKVYPLKTDKSSAHTNIMHSEGKRLSIYTSSPTNKPPVVSNIENLIQNADVVFLNINDFCRDYIPYLQKADKMVVVDIHDYDPPNPYHQDFINIADIITVSGVYIQNHEKFLKDLIDNGKQIVVLTKGKEGLIAIDKHYHFYRLKGYNEMSYVDSNGAGDSFTAGFIDRYLETSELLESLQFGTICGGLACTTFELYNRDYTKEKVKEIKKRVIL